MRSAAPPVILLICVLAVGLVAVPGAGAASGASADEAIEDPSEPILVFEIALDENGTASWTVSARFPIGEPEQRDAFEALAAEYMNDEEDQYLSADPYEVAAAELSEELDRPMGIENTNRSVDRSNEVGELILTFDWTGFADVPDNHTMRVGDVFTATERPWLSTLQADEYLRIHAPPGYAIDTSGMPVSDRTVWMDGPADLSGEELHSVFVLEAEQNGNGDDDNGDDEPPEEPPQSIVLPVVGGAAAVLGLLVVALLLGYLAGWTPVNAAVGAVRSDEEEPDEDETEPAAEAGAEPDETELLSDEERVLALIEENGGRMKQAAIVEETDWSNAKVSQLLSEMAEEGSVEKLRIGRENLISLPDYENGR